MIVRYLPIDANVKAVARKLKFEIAFGQLLGMRRKRAGQASIVLNGSANRFSANPSARAEHDADRSDQFVRIIERRLGLGSSFIEFSFQIAGHTLSLAVVLAEVSQASLASTKAF